MAFTLTSPAFVDGATIPARFTCEGGNISPELRWDGAPGETASYVLVMHDPDAPNGDFTHCLLYDLPPGTSGLAEGDRAGSAGINSFGKMGYGGPCPPPGHGPHRYYFDLYALNSRGLGLTPGASRSDLERAMKGHILAEANLMGRYERKA